MPSSLPPAAEPMDAAAALARLGGNADLLREVAALFLEECSQWVAELRGGFSRNDAPRVRHAAHQLRGSLGCLAARPAGDAARDVETAARAGDLAAASRACDDLQWALQRLTPAVASLAGRAPEAPAGDTP